MLYEAQTLQNAGNQPSNRNNHQRWTHSHSIESFAFLRAKPMPSTRNAFRETDTEGVFFSFPNTKHQGFVLRHSAFTNVIRPNFPGTKYAASPVGDQTNGVGWPPATRVR